MVYGYQKTQQVQVYRNGSIFHLKYENASALEYNDSSGNDNDPVLLVQNLLELH